VNRAAQFARPFVRGSGRSLWRRTAIHPIVKDLPHVEEPMLYSILIYASEEIVGAMTQEEDDAHVARHLKVHKRLNAQGKPGPVMRLMPTVTACQLRTTGEPVVLDGPFAETKEQLLGLRYFPPNGRHASAPAQ
jgi:YCII-related domain